MGWQRPLESETEIWEMMLGTGSRCWDGQPGKGLAGRQERGEAGTGTMCSDHTCATDHTRTMALLAPQVPATFVARCSQAASNYLCSLMCSGWSTCFHISLILLLADVLFVKGKYLKDLVIQHWHLFSLSPAFSGMY